MYEATLKSGRSLHERAQTSHDRQHLENLLAELKDTWDTISGKSVERYVPADFSAKLSFVQLFIYLFIFLLSSQTT